MSRDIEFFVEHLGIPVKIVRGQNENNGHMWVNILGLDIDSVTLLHRNNREKYSIKIIEFNSYDDYINSPKS
jgi:hypothetical protein